MRAILTYHSVDPSGSVISVDEPTLRRHAEWLAASPAAIVSVSELLDMPDDRDALAIVFDDAFENFGTVAWPILRDLGLPVTVFVVTGQVGKTNAWGGREQAGLPTLPLLDWTALGSLADEGVELGSHTRSHPHLDRLEESRIIDEIEGAAEDIRAELGTRPGGFAYPYGDLDERAVAVASTVHDWACTADLNTLSGDLSMHRLPRLDAFYYRRPGQLEAWGTGTFRARLSLRRTAREARQWVAGRKPA